MEKWIPLFKHILNRHKGTLIFIVVLVCFIAYNAVRKGNPLKLFWGMLETKEVQKDTTKANLEKVINLNTSGDNSPAVYSEKGNVLVDYRQKDTTPHLESK